MRRDVQSKSIEEDSTALFQTEEPLMLQCLLASNGIDDFGWKLARKAASFLLLHHAMLEPVVADINDCMCGDSHLLGNTVSAASKFKTEAISLGGCAVPDAGVIVSALASQRAL